jgi:hypothetical protein
MPCPKYYRPILPMDINRLVGLFAGYGKARLVFTLTPKRFFLGPIFIQGIRRFKKIRRRLKPTSWVTVRRCTVGYRKVVLKQLERHFYHQHDIPYYKHDFYGGLENLDEWLQDIIDYSIKI